MLRELGAAVVDADQAAHAVYEPGTPGYDAVVKEFGSEITLAGRIDRARLGTLVFKDPDARRRLNAIVHPLVRDWMAERTVEALERGVDVVVQDVPLIFENNLESLYSAVVLVYVPEDLQVSRLVEGRGLSEERARAIVAAQMPIEDKKSRTHHVIDNRGSIDKTREQVQRLWAAISATRSGEGGPEGLTGPG